MFQTAQGGFRKHNLYTVMDNLSLTAKVNENNLLDQLNSSRDRDPQKSFYNETVLKLPRMDTTMSIFQSTITKPESRLGLPDLKKNIS